MLLPMAMFSNRTIIAAVFTIAIATSLIVVSGGLVASAVAKKEKEKQNGSDMVSTVSSSSKDSSSPPAALGDDSTKSGSANADDSSGSTGDTSDIPGTNLRSLSKCQSSAAEDGDLTQAEGAKCLRQVFWVCIKKPLIYQHFFDNIKNIR